MNRLLLIFLSIWIMHSLQAKDGPEFDTYEWNFGKLQESEGVVSHTFILTNKGKEKLQITKVIISCSCVNVDYPRNPIEPGKSEEVTVQLSPSGAVGKIFRTVEFYDGSNQCFGTIEIKADVPPMNRSIQQRYPHTVADMIYVSQVKVPFGYVYHGEHKSKTIHIANSSDKTVRIDAGKLSGNLSVTTPVQLEPGEENEMSLTYSSPDRPELFATFADTVFIQIDGKPSRIPITTEMICMAKTANSDDAPVLRTYPSLGKTKKKSKNKYTARIDFFNDGQSNLVIHTLETPKDVQSNVTSGTILPPGEKLEVELTRSTKTPYHVNLFTNDPSRPFKDIMIE